MQQTRLMPHNCGAQGWYEERPERPEPAEACTEIGAESEKCQELPLLVRIWLAFRRAVS